ncbi:MAG: CDP-alcohol phosphatidyltransferase family protein [Phycisphaerae bacterium]|jgi:CDP-diacylglycerol--glycerol-3-phosphate 3-phosphatidyltransferase
MNWNIPNRLTVGRIVLAMAFFVLLGLYEHNTAWGRWVLNAAFVIYIIAGITDVLDGWLARRLKVESAFGRISDPFVDKVLVVGAFAMLTGSNFLLGSADHLEHSLPTWVTGHMASAVQAWMVVAILAREFVISAVRGYSESRGVQFAATSAGKVKMFVQSVTICTVLYQLANLPQVPWAVYTKITLVWLAAIVTVASALAYVGRTRRLLVKDE